MHLIRGAYLTYFRVGLTCTAVRIQYTAISSGMHNYTMLYLIYVGSNNWSPLLKTLMYLHMITDHAFYCFCCLTAQVTTRDFVQQEIVCQIKRTLINHSYLHLPPTFQVGLSCRQSIVITQSISWSVTFTKWLQFPCGVPLKQSKAFWPIRTYTEYW